MRWKARKRKDFSEWNKWFAWRPVRIDGTDTIVWLEYVERKGSLTYYSIRYEYKELMNPVDEIVNMVKEVEKQTGKRPDKLFSSRSALNAVYRGDMEKARRDGWEV